MNHFYRSKLTQYGLLLLLTILLNFWLPRLMPGNPLVYLAGEEVGFMSSAEKEKILEVHGLNQSLHIQLIKYIGNVAQGELGYSYQKKMPVLAMIKSRLPWTLLLCGINLVLSTVIGVLAGAFSAAKRGSKSDVSLLTFFMFLSAMPSFWIGMILAAVFGAQLGWLPIFGAETVASGLTGIERMMDILRHLVLPLSALVLVSVTSVYTTMRNAMIGILREDYITLAKAKGFREWTITYKHALRNALLPVATLFMLNIGFMFGGATVIETVFAYPGIGRLMYEAVMSRDYPVIQACFFFTTLTVILANLAADLLYPLLDSRVVRKV